MERCLHCSGFRGMMFRRQGADVVPLLCSPEASHAGLPVESCPELLSRLELAAFGHCLSGAHTWRAVQDAAIEDATSNPHLVKR